MMLNRNQTETLATYAHVAYWVTDDFEEASIYLGIRNKLEAELLTEDEIISVQFSPIEKKLMAKIVKERKVDECSTLF